MSENKLFVVHYTVDMGKGDTHMPVTEYVHASSLEEVKNVFEPVTLMLSGLGYKSVDRITSVGPIEEYVPPEGRSLEELRDRVTRWVQNEDQNQARFRELSK